MVKIINEPHYRYPDWPGKTTLKFLGGLARLENMHDGSELIFEAHVGLALHEAMILRDHLDAAIAEQEALMAKAERLNAPWDYASEVVPDMD